MSHQTGIVATDELRNFFARSKDGSIRTIKVSIQNEDLVLELSAKTRGSWEQDYNEQVLPLLEPNLPTYVFYRLDSKNNMGYEWVLISWTPDFSPVRQKMLYAATRATLKKEFGSGQIKEDLFGTVKEDVTLEGYKKHLVAQRAPPPMTMAEEELREIKERETRTEIGVDTRQQTLQGLAFPIDDAAINRLIQLRDGAVSYVQLKIDIGQERIHLASYDNIKIDQLADRIPSDAPRYHLFTFKHAFEGDFLESIVFIYSMPGYNCSIKERMLYSSCKSPFLEGLERQLGITVSRKLEIENGNELSQDYLFNELHPPKNVATQQFARPKAPGRGPKRTTRTTNE